MLVACRLLYVIMHSCYGTDDCIVLWMQNKARRVGYAQNIGETPLQKITRKFKKGILVDHSKKGWIVKDYISLQTPSKENKLLQKHEVRNLLYALLVCCIYQVTASIWKAQLMIWIECVTAKTTVELASLCGDTGWLFACRRGRSLEWLRISESRQSSGR